jgi:hypothetical protein
MSKPLATDLFVEDSAHEVFVRALVERLAGEAGRSLTVHIRCARGGHGRVLAEYRLYQETVLKRVGGLSVPDVLVIAVDCNCRGFNAAREEVLLCVDARLAAKVAVACPDPHIERWYLADPDSFHEVVGVRPVPGKKKCERDRYKALLSKAVREAGHPSTLGGIEFGPELVAKMDLYRAGKTEKSLKHFLDDAARCLNALA